MRILVLSDSHYEEIGISLLGYDLVIHCGDYGRSLKLLEDNSVSYVCGNCDCYGDKLKLIELNDKKIMITHGDLYNVKVDYNRLLYKALEANANIVFFGHTHIPAYFNEVNISFINPGAYKDGHYVIIENNIIYYYLNDKIIKEIRL